MYKTPNNLSPLNPTEKMVKQSKNETAAPVAATPANKPAKASKPSKKVTAAAPVAETKPAPKAAAVVAAPVAAPAAEATETENSEESSVSWETERDRFGANLASACAVMAKLRADFKNLNRAFDRERRADRKKNARRKSANTGNRQPVGFTKPTHISDELASFLGLEAGKEISRVDVCKLLYAYIKNHNLQDATNGRKIIPNAPLKTLLRIKDEDQLTYFNLQSFLKTHFTKAKAASA